MEGNKKNGKNLPEKKFSCGAVTATIWKNTGNTKAGMPISYYSVSLDRRYLDKDGKWNSTSSFRIMDLPKVNLVMSKAFEFTSLRENGSAQEEVHEESVVF